MRNMVFLPAILLLTLLAGCSESSPTPTAVAARESAPDFTAADLHGKSVRLSDYRGKVVFLNFWATWCPPCRAEMPSMERLHGVMDDKNFAILAVNIENDSSSVKDFLTQNPHSFKVLSDADAKVQNLYKVFRFPETFLIDKQGKIIQHYVGARDWSSVEFLKYVSALTSE